MRLYPALDIGVGDFDLMLATLDDFSPTAIEERGNTLRAFFPSLEARDAALSALADRFTVNALDVSDEDWARRSQEDLQPVTVGRITIFASAQFRISSPESLIPSPEISIVIEPSMGFGTGHHATTRLCLEALQHVDVGGKRVLDVGTGSGILAIAASRLGAIDAAGIDVDADAIQSARENLALNPDALHVHFNVIDLRGAPLPTADLVVANLTGALLARQSAALRAAVAPNGVLIVSGLQTGERDAVVGALKPAAVIWEREEDSWIGLAMKNP